jgi:hypothetical protein
MDKRLRSPNYPALSLPEAINRATALYRSQHTHAAPREVMARGMGYSTLNGASASAISALHKYGLLERAGDEMKVSDRMMRILHPQSADERGSAIREAARSVQLFEELDERFPGRMPNDDLLRNYLVRKGFAPAAVSSVILAYRETSELVGREAGPHDSPAPMQEKSEMMTTTPIGGTEGARSTVSAQSLGKMVADERPIGRYDYEDGSYIRIMAHGEIDTEEALEMVETLIALKRKELERRKTVVASRTANADLAGATGADAPHNLLETQARVSLMITQAQKAALKERGYTDEEIRDMTPEDAHRTLGSIN